MPPRYAYWVIILDGSASSFRARSREELQPTFNRLRAKSPNATMQWFERGKLFDSPEEARRDRLKEAGLWEDRDPTSPDALPRRYVGASRGPGAGGPFRTGDRRPKTGDRRNDRDRGPGAGGPFRTGDRRPKTGDRRNDRDRGPGTGTQFRTEHRSQASGARSQESGVRSKDRTRGRREDTVRGSRPEGASEPRSGQSDRTVGGEKPRGKDWRPGGEHRDPRDKYKGQPGERRKRWKERFFGKRRDTGGKPGATGDRDGPRTRPGNRPKKR